MCGGMASEELQQALTVDRYPRSSAYDQQWVVDNLMGPHPLWQVEALMQVMTLEPGMRVLDLGCGTALSSIFLAREYDVEVFAADLWVKPTQNWERVEAAGLEGRVHPIYVDARDLPFAADFFDAVVSVGSYHYFGTDARYMADLSAVVRPGGSIGIVVPGLHLEPGAPLPLYLAEHWVPDFATFFGPAWWRQLWERTGLVTVQVADLVPHGWEDWLRWLEACNLVGRGSAPDEAMLRADGGRLLSQTRVVAQVR